MPNTFEIEQNMTVGAVRAIEEFSGSLTRDEYEAVLQEAHKLADGDDLRRTHIESALTTLQANRGFK